LLAVAIMLGSFYIGYVALASEQRKEQFSSAWEKFKPHNKVKILFGFLMIATKVDDVYDVELPPTIKGTLAQFEYGVSLGFNGATSVLECLGVAGYQNVLLAYMLVPIVCAMLVLLSAAIMTRPWCTTRGILQTSAPLLLKLLFLAFPLVTNVAFEAFYTYRFEDSEWLRADVTIQVGTSKYDRARMLAWLAILLYPFGCLVLCATLLFAARRAILMGKPTALSRAISFLYQEYEAHFFWWELVEMLRRVLLVGLLVLVQGMMQVIVGTLLAAFFLFVQVQAAPYKDTADDFLASASSFSLIVIFLCCYAFKDFELVGLPDIDAKLSREQRATYVVDQRLLAVIMFMSVVGSLFISVFLFFMQLAAEGARLRHERSANKARRLRYKVNHHAVLVSALDDRHYHTFLSHVWGTGQDQMRIVKQRLLEMIQDLHVFLDVDDLEEIGDLENYIERSSTILVYCSNGYFTSKNCMREVMSSTNMGKFIIPLIDLDSSRGGLSLGEVHAQLQDADSLYKNWGFTDDASSMRWPGSATLYAHLFAHEPIEWNRIGHFQDVTMRLIAERLLLHGCGLEKQFTPRPGEHEAGWQGSTYVDRELISMPVRPLPPALGTFHVYCSNLNPGAMTLMTEVAGERGLSLFKDGESVAQNATTSHVEVTRLKHGTMSSSEGRISRQKSPTRQLSRWSRMGAHRDRPELHTTTELESLADCDHMLLYLTSQTWTRGQASERLGTEVLQAMNSDVHVLLAHEMTGVGGQEHRFGCEFSSFFNCREGATPVDLLKRGVYSEIAVPLKGGAWRETSMVLLVKSLAMSQDDIEMAKEGGDFLRLGLPLSGTRLSSVSALTRTKPTHALRAGRDMISGVNATLFKHQVAVPSVVGDVADVGDEAHSAPTGAPAPASAGALHRARRARARGSRSFARKAQDTLQRTASGFSVTTIGRLGIKSAPSRVDAQKAPSSTSAMAGVADVELSL